MFEHNKDFFDHAASAAFTYDPIIGLEYDPSHYANLGLQPPMPSPPFETMSMLGSEYTLSPQPTMAFMPSPPSVERSFTPSDGGVHPPALVPVSAGELSSDSNRVPSPAGYSLRHGVGHRRNSSATSIMSHHSPLVAPSPLAGIPRAARFNPIATPARPQRERKSRRKTSDDFNSDDEDEDYSSAPLTSAPGTDARREEIRRQRIESEQRRRDELRDGYRRLKDALPPSNQKSSKVFLLDRATTHVKCLEVSNAQLQQRVAAAEAEVSRLRQFNEALMLNTAEARHAAVAAAAAQAQLPVF